MLNMFECCKKKESEKGKILTKFVKTIPPPIVLTAEILNDPEVVMYPYESPKSSNNHSPVNISDVNSNLRLRRY